MHCWRLMAPARQRTTQWSSLKPGAAATAPTTLQKPSNTSAIQYNLSTPVLLQLSPGHHLPACSLPTPTKSPSTAYFNGNMPLLCGSIKAQHQSILAMPAASHSSQSFSFLSTIEWMCDMCFCIAVVACAKKPSVIWSCHRLFLRYLRASRMLSYHSSSLSFT